MPDLELTLPAVFESIPLARRAVDRLEGEVDEEQLEALRLLVSEMVSNGIRHGQGSRTVEVRIRLGSRSIHLEVEDRGPGFRRPRPDPEAGGGWGLVIVDRLARRWGVLSGPKTTVWLELDRYAKTA
jgi:anti-sigma regulatory factor (Ser/Thr protein kinase)